MANLMNALARPGLMALRLFHWLSKSDAQVVQMDCGGVRWLLGAPEAEIHGFQTLLGDDVTISPRHTKLARRSTKAAVQALSKDSPADVLVFCAPPWNWKRSKGEFHFQPLVTAVPTQTMMSKVIPNAALPGSLRFSETAQAHGLGARLAFDPQRPILAGKTLTEQGNTALERLQLLISRSGTLVPITPRQPVQGQVVAPGSNADTAEETDRENTTPPVPHDRSSNSRGIINTFLHMGFATAVTSVLGLGIKLALPRLMGTEQMGRLYFAESMAIMFFGFLPLGIASYISREVPKDPSRARTILAVILPVQFLLALIIGLALMGFLWMSGTDSVTLQCGAAMAFFAASTVFNRSIIGRTYLSLDQPALVARVEIFTRLALIGLLFLGFLTNLSAPRVAWCYGLSGVFGVVLMLLAARRDGLLALRWDTKDLKEIVITSLPFFAVSALIEIYGNIDTAMLKYLGNTNEVAYYGSANKLKGAALVLLPILQAALQPALSRTWATDHRAFGDLVSHGMRILVAASMPLTLAFLILPDGLAHWIFGSEFALSQLAIACLAPILTLTSLNVLMGACLNIMGRGIPFLIVVLLSVLTNIALNGIAIGFALERFGPGSGAAAAALATVLSELLVLLAMRQIFRLGLNFFELLKFLVLALSPCFLAALAWTELLATPLSLRMLLLAGFAPFYLWVTGLLRVEDIDWVLRNRFGKERRRNLSAR